MNQDIKQFIQNLKKANFEKELAARNKHLIGLGLTDENNITREYIEYPAIGSIYDAEKKMSYIEIKGALSITDEEYNEICRYSPPSPPQTANKTEALINCINKNVSLIKSIMVFFTVLYVISAIILAIALLA